MHHKGKKIAHTKAFLHPLWSTGWNEKQLIESTMPERSDKPSHNYHRATAYRRALAANQEEWPVKWQQRVSFAYQLGYCTTVYFVYWVTGQAIKKVNTQPVIYDSICSMLPEEFDCFFVIGVFPPYEDDETCVV